MVGAIADQRLAGKAVAAKIANLLDGLSLEEAAVLADSIKAWDKKSPKNPNTFHLPDHPEIEKQLVAFLQANPATNHDPNNTKLPPNHHWFHYTDVPVTGNATYKSGKTGRHERDVVHMISYCIKVLKGKEPENNDYKITKPVAVILLAHYVGDIHQPLHVGAVYFDDKGQPVNPDDAGSGFGDNGGNDLLLILHQPSDHGHQQATFKLHSYWDDQAVLTAFDLVRKEIQKGRNGRPRIIPVTEITRRLATSEPAGWKLPEGTEVEEWSVKWADEILPLARQAHDRLEFKQILVDPKKKSASGFAVERTQQEGIPYHDWSGQIVRDELHKAGWRLAELLERVVE
jgi:hypothetical protein